MQNVYDSAHVKIGLFLLEHTIHWSVHYALTSSSLGGRVGATGTALLLDVVGLPIAPDTQRVRLVLPLTETRRTLRLKTK